MNENKARRAFSSPLWTVQRKSEKEIRALLTQTANQLERDLRRVRPGSTREAQLRESMIAVRRRLAQMWEKQGNYIRANRELAIAEAVRSSVDWDRLLVSDASMPYNKKHMLRQGMKDSAERNVELMIRRFSSENLELSRQVYRTQALASGWVQREINEGIGKGASADDIAKAVRHMVLPTTPGGVAYAAKRLARTEINLAYHKATVAESLGKPWISGLSWRLSTSHVGEDRCDFLARQDDYGLGRGTYPVDELPDPPHPQCMCYKVPATVEPDDFVDGFLNGQYDDYLASKYGI